MTEICVLRLILRTTGFVTESTGVIIRIRLSSLLYIGQWRWKVYFLFLFWSHFYSINMRDPLLQQVLVTSRNQFKSERIINLYIILHPKMWAAVSPFLIFPFEDCDIMQVR